MSSRSRLAPAPAVGSRGSARRPVTISPFGFHQLSRRRPLKNQQPDRGVTDTPRAAQSACTVGTGTTPHEAGLAIGAVSTPVAWASESSGRGRALRAPGHGRGCHPTTLGALRVCVCVVRPSPAPGSSGGDQVEVTVEDEALETIPDLFLLQGQSTGLPDRPTDEASRGFCCGHPPQGSH